MHVRTPKIICTQNKMNGEIVSHGDEGKRGSPKLKYNKGRRRGPVPDFLRKTYNIVNDPNTNSVISWSSSATSFVIWDHNEFSATVIPRYFKHNNLSSFVYQLSNYGFRKIGVDHEWEYANPNFQGGREDLLQNIKRRGQIRETQNNPSPYHNNRLEILRNEINESKLEIERLRIRQSTAELRIAAFESEIRSFDSHWAREVAKKLKNEEDDLGDSGDYEYWKKSVIKGSAGTGVQNNISMDLEDWIANLAECEIWEL